MPDSKAMSANRLAPTARCCLARARKVIEDMNFLLRKICEELRGQSSGGLLRQDYLEMNDRRKEIHTARDAEKVHAAKKPQDAQADCGATARSGSRILKPGSIPSSQ